MKLLILDFLRRWAWVYVPAVGIQFLILLFASTESGPFALLIAIFSGLTILAYEFALGTSRVYRTLPLRRRDLINFWRFLGIAPILQFVGVFLAAIILRAILRLGNPVSLSQFSIWMTVGLLLMVSGFYLIDQLVVIPQQRFFNRAKKLLAKVVWSLLQVGAFFFLINCPDQWSSLRLWQWLWILSAAAISLFEFGRSEKIVLNRAAPSPEYEGSLKRVVHRVTGKLLLKRPTGLKFFLLEVAWNAVAMWGTASLVVVIFAVAGKKHPGEDWLVAGSRALKDSTYFWPVMFFMISANSSRLVVIRHLRSLPMLARHLTLLICTVSVAPFFVFMGTTGACEFFFRQDFQFTQWLSCSSMFSAVILFPPTWFLRYGNTVPTFMLSFVCLILGLALLAVAFQTPVIIAFLVCLSGWALGAWLIYGAICKQSETYRKQSIWPKTAQ